MRQLTGKLLTVLALVTFSVTATSQTISSLWRSVDATVNSDQPKTRIQLLRQIVQKSEAQRSFGDLLKAEIMITDAFSEISGDSVAPQVRYLASRAEKYRGTNAVLAALYCTAVANSLRAYPSALSYDAGADEDVTKPVTWYKKALENPSALAQAVALDYQPLIEGGRDDRTFLGDLFHVIALQGSEYKAMRDYYMANGNRNAACISELLLLRRDNKEQADLYRSQKSKYLHSVDSLITVYEDLPEAGELAIEHFNCINDADDVRPEQCINYINYALSKWGAWPRMNILRNAKSRLTMPSFQVVVGEGGMMPRREHKVIVTSALNIKELTMNVYRLNERKAGVDTNGFCKRIENLMYGDVPPVTDKSMRSIVEQEPVCTQTRRYIGQPAYRQLRDTMTIQALEPGYYVVEFTTDNNLMASENCIIAVSDAMLLTLPQPGGVRMVAVSATTGEPLPDAAIAFRDESNENASVRIVRCDARGEYVDTEKKSRRMVMKALAGDDKYAMWQSSTGSFYYNSSANTIYRCDVFTDRSIYRPGQTVHVAMLSYRSVKHMVTRAERNKKLTFTLSSQNGKQLVKKEVVTDDMGMASVDVQLPANIMPGYCVVRVEGDNNTRGNSLFRVEQYKRPTFTIAFDKVRKNYANGDTLTLKGNAESFAGVPVQNGRVVYTITRRPSLFWRYDARRDRSVQMASDTVYTDDKGRFAIPVELTMPDVENDRTPRYYQFAVDARVTNAAGETHTASETIPLSNRSSFFNATMSDRVERNDSMRVVFNYSNVAGTDVDTLVSYTISPVSGGKEVVSTTARSNREVALPVRDVLSGEYVINATAGADTLSRRFVVFSATDGRPVVKTRDWFYCSSETMKDDGTPVILQAGSSEKQHILYSVMSGKRVLESGAADVNDSIFTRRVSYNAADGDAILVSYAWVKDGVVYRHDANITRRLPDNRLVMGWKTFRDRLTPGQKEQWTLSITDKSGKPAKAQLLAVLFDKSLDDINAHKWNFMPYRYIASPSTSWGYHRQSGHTLYGEMKFNALPVRDLDFAHFDDRLNMPLAVDEVCLEMIQRPMMMAKAGAMAKQSAHQLTVRGVSNMMAIADSSVKIGSYEVTPQQGESNAVRENLNETAFFYPALMTDSNGDVKINFTLPESVTTWRFMGLAHDSLMNYADIEASVVARKTVMIQPDVPRFLRSGDKATISAMISNTSQKNASGNAMIVIADPETGETIVSESTKFNLAAGDIRVVTFKVDASQLPSLSTVTFTAEGKNFSDGEQHYLPVLPDKEMVTTTLPFDMTSAGTKVLDMTKLFKDNGQQRKLTVEYTDNPEWLVLQTLPIVATPDGDNAVSVAAAYYANMLGRKILTSQPGMKGIIERWQTEEKNNEQMVSPLERNSELKSVVLDESPWLRSAQKETEQRRMLINFFDESAMDYRLADQLSKLRMLQLSDGGFTWWKGMTSNAYITTSVIEMLTRLKMMTGAQPQTEDILNNAFMFMDKVVSKSVKEMKESSRKNNGKLSRPSELMVQYMYSCAVSGRKLGDAAAADHRYLIDCMKKSGKEMTIYGKSAAALILSRHAVSNADDKRMASEYVRSIKEHTVYNELKGRYFDSWKAQYSWCDYRIPSQVAAIEAIRNVTPGDTATVNEMRQWLLQEKRTTAWSTPLNTVNAVYAFTDGGRKTMTTGSADNVVIALDGKKLTLPESASATGYVKTVVDKPEMKVLEITKKCSGMSWGAVYGQQMQQNTDIDDASSEITVKREILRNGKSAGQLNVGDRITVRITVRAERDFDFVKITDKRAACMEPVTQLSGYANGCYRVLKDNATCFFFDKLKKGTKVVSVDYYVDREGVYDTGVCKVECAYSPEYSGRTKAKNITVTKE